MTDLPDAPWIREAERYGLPEVITMRCPICKTVGPSKFVINDWGEITGCSCCSHFVDPENLKERRYAYGTN